MNLSTGRSEMLALACVLALAGAPATAADGSKGAAEAGFSGRWALLVTRDDGPGRIGETPGIGFDLPLEVMTDARLLVIVDDGTTLGMNYPSGRKRTFVTDGGKRYLDDGDGPADVTARRKGTTVSVLSEWFRGYKLRETWDLRENPRRLVVTGKVKGRESQEYLRTYEPAPPEKSSPSPVKGDGSFPSSVPESAPGETPASSGTPIEPPPPVLDRLAECSIHPPRNASSAELGRLVRISQETAGKAAVESLAPQKPGDVISSDVESFEGCLAWPFTIRLPQKKGLQEIFVDAGDGKVIRSEFIPIGPPLAETPAP